MTKDNWIKAFDNHFKDLGFHSLPLHQDISDEVKSFISQVEKNAIEKTKRECEDLHKNDSTPEEIRELMENVEKQAIEKTNKRWRERIGEKAEKRLWTNTVANNMHVVKKYHQGINDLVSDLLEDKK